MEDLTHIPISYSFILLLATAGMMLSVSYIGLLLLASRKWTELCIQSAPVLQASVGVCSLFIGIGAMFIKLDPVALIGYVNPITPNELFGIGVFLTIFSVMNMTNMWLNFPLRVFALSMAFMVHVFMMLIGVPVMHVRPLFWFSTSMALSTGFALIVLTGFTRRIDRA